MPLVPMETYQSNYSPSSYGQTGLFNFGMAANLSEGQFYIQTS